MWGGPHWASHPYIQPAKCPIAPARSLEGPERSLGWQTLALLTELQMWPGEWCSFAGTEKAQGMQLWQLPPPSRVQALCCRSGSLQRDGRDSRERAVAVVLKQSPQGRQIPERYLARVALGNFQQHPKTAILCSGPGGGTSIHLISHQDCWRDRAPVRASSLAEGFGGSLMEAIEGPCFAIAGPPNHDTEASTGISN